MDVVRVLKESRMKNIELMYSIRSVFHNLCQFDPNKDTIFIVGHKPEWIKYSDEKPYRVIHIPCSEESDDIKLESKYKSVAYKYTIIINDKRISRDFVLMHDDIFIIKKIKKLGAYRIGKLKTHIKKHKKKFKENPYYRVIKPVYDNFPDGYSFETHTPAPFNKSKFKKLLKKFPFGTKGSKRSLYYNYFGIEPKKIPGVKNDGKTLHDCKIFRTKEFLNKQKEIQEKRSILSISDRLAAFSSFKVFINTNFPNPCPYEIPFKTPDYFFRRR